MAARKRVNLAKQREQRTKVVAIVGFVIFLAVAGYEVPSVLKLMNAKPPAPATHAVGTSTTVSLPNLAAPATATAAPSGLASGGGLADTDVPPASGAGQLVSFTLFQSKNPFTPQVKSSTSPAGSLNVAPGVDAPAGTVVPVPAATTPTTTTTTPSLVPATPGGTASPATTTTTTAAPPPSVAISVNGTVSHVATDGTFPTGSPVFRLVGYTPKSAQIGIVGGSYADGGAALTLQQGVPVTLQNTTDGKRYTLLLVSTP